MMHERIDKSNAAGIPAETLALMVELLPTITSLRDLCAITGLRLDTVRRETAPFLALMKLNGTHPKCGCGKDRFHPYGCVDSYAKADLKGRIPGRSYEVSAEMRARRQLIIDRLVSGDRFIDISRDFGIDRGSVRKYLRWLSSEQLAQRNAVRPPRVSNGEGRTC